MLQILEVPDSCSVAIDKKSLPYSCVFYSINVARPATSGDRIPRVSHEIFSHCKGTKFFAVLQVFWQLF